MNIGELAKRSGLAPSRIRFYESIGLLKMVERRPNGYRTYQPEALVLLELIATAQTAGFSLDEIRSLVPQDLETWEHDTLLATLKRKVADIEALEARLAQSRKQLVALIGDIEAKPDDIDCAENARRVLSRMLHKSDIAHVEADNVKQVGKAGRRRSQTFATS
jgi:DNA-binding transcriptional MerR regulator